MSSRTVPQRKIGNDDTPAIGYGAMGIGGIPYGKAASDEERFKVLDRLLELGCTHWDTSAAAVYGDSEELIGKWFTKTGNRDKIFLATKFGILSNGGVRGDPEFVHETVEASLKKLQTDRIDLLYQHRPDTKVPIEVTVRAMKELVDQGKVRYLGLSEVHPKDIRRAHKVHPIAALQIEYSPWERDLETVQKDKNSGEELESISKVAKDLGIAIVAYSPVGRGLVTGAISSYEQLDENDNRRKMPRYQPKNWPRINKLVEEFTTIGKKHNATPAQVALAWLLTLGDNVIPIPGSRQIKYVEENIAALDIKFSPDELKEITKLSDEIADVFRADDRYAATNMAHVQRETPPEK